MTSRVNHLAVFVSAAVFFLLGSVWYTVLFGQKWMALTGAAEKTAPAMGPTFAMSFILSWILAYVIAIALADTTNPNPVRHGLEFGIFMGIGIFGTMTLMDYLYEGRSVALWLINAGYVVAGMAVMGAIIGAWRKKAPAAAT